MRKSAPKSNDVDHAPRHSDCLGPETRRGMHQLYDRLHRVHKLIKLRLRDDERGGDLQHHEIIPANLAVYPVISEQAHHQHWTEHRRMDSREGLEQDPEAKLPGWLKLNGRHHSEAANVLDHLILRQPRLESRAQSCTQLGSTLAEIAIFKNVQSGQSGAHRKAVFAVG